MKRLNRKHVIEAIAALLVISTLSWVMLPRFMGSQTMIRINHNEKELQRLLKDIQTPGSKILQEIQNANEESKKWAFSGDEIEEQFPGYTFYHIENDMVGFVKLGMDHIPEKEEEELPIAVFYITNHRDIKNYTFDYFEMKKASKQDKLFSLDNQLSGSFRTETYRVTTWNYLKPNPSKYFSITNGINSNGIVYLDNQGRSWRDGKE